MLRRSYPLLRTALSFLFAVAALSVSGCDSSDDPLLLGDGPLLPLATGNEWRYEQTYYDDGRTITYTVRVGEVVELADGPAFAMTVDFGTSEETFAARNTDAGLLFLYQDEPDILFRFPAEDGESYYYPNAAQGQLYTVGRAEAEVPTGRYAVVTYTGYDADPEIRAAFAPGVGLVELRESRSRSVLTSRVLSD